MRFKPRPLILIFLLVFCLVALGELTGLFEPWELQLVDLRFKARGSQPVDPEVVHIDINADTLKTLGGWGSWNAGRHAIAVNILEALDAKALGVDIFFTEKTERVLNLAKLGATGRDGFSLGDLDRIAPDPVRAFSLALSNSDFVVLAQLFEDQPADERTEFYRVNQTNSLKYQTGRFRIPVDKSFFQLKEQSKLTPVLAEYARFGAGTGIAQVEPDLDGVVRRAPLLFKSGDYLYPSLGLATALVARGLSLADLSPESSAEKLVFARDEKRLEIPIRRDGSIYLNWRGGVHDAHPRISWLALNWLARGIVLKEIKSVLSEVGQELAFNREAFLQLPAIEQLQARFGDGTPLAGSLALPASDRDSASLVEEVWADLLPAILIQEMLDENPQLMLSEFYAKTGQDESPYWSQFFYGIKYANLLISRADLLARQQSKEELEALDIEDGELFEEYRLLIKNEQPDPVERPYLFNLPPIIDGGPIYSSWFKGKICLYGLTASGTHDLNPVPLDSRYPMVGVHATVVDNILSSGAIIRVSTLVNLLIILGLSLVAGLSFRKAKSAVIALTAILLLVGFLGLNWVLFSHQAIWLDLVAPLVLILGFFIVALLYNYLGEEREKKQLRGAFSRYVAPTLVEQIIHDPSILRLGGEKRVCTVFFSDIAGFTSLSEGLEPEKLVEFLNAYLTEVTEIVLAHGGMLDKYQGDAVMAVFGAPLPQADHATRACRAALAVQARLSELRQAWQAGGLPEFITRIGLNSGEMVVGNMGSRERFDYTVIGDAVNLGSRLESANKQYGTYTMISAATRELADPELFITRELDLIRVKGKDEPVRVFELLA